MRMKLSGWLGITVKCDSRQEFRKTALKLGDDVMMRGPKACVVGSCVDAHAYRRAEWRACVSSGPRDHARGTGAPPEPPTTARRAQGRQVRSLVDFLPVFEVVAEGAILFSLVLFLGENPSRTAMKCAKVQRASRMKAHTCA